MIKYTSDGDWVYKVNKKCFLVSRILVFNWETNEEIDIKEYKVHLD